MPNIRIKDIPTTASATSSTDFIGIDGSANGTRKLDAYSPTFGGNLTVSGGTITGGTSGLSLASGGTNKSITLTPTGTGFTVIQGVGSKTSIGDFPLVTSYAALYQGVTTPGSANYTVASNGQELVLNAPSGSYQIRFQVGSEVARLNASGNLLLGTTTDSGNGKLQLATHTTSAGGIGFGTDVALYRAGGNTLKLELGVSAGALWFDNGGDGAGGARILGSSGALTITSNGANSLYLQTGGITALTLDSSRNATFAGSIKFSNALGDILDSASNRVLRLYSGALLVSTGATASTGATLQVGGDATFTGVLITQGGTASTPASASATGTAGTIKWDASYIYVCTAANTWKRVAIATW